MQPIQSLTWLIQHHAEIVAQILAVLIALTVLVQGMHAVVIALAGLAKLTPSKADDEALGAADRWLDKAEGGLAWMQAHLPHVGINRAKMALRKIKATGTTVVIADGVGSLPPEDPTSAPTKPDRPRAKR